jgi:hypothetical protein
VKEIKVENPEAVIVEETKETKNDVPEADFEKET